MVDQIQVDAFKVKVLHSADLTEKNVRVDAVKVKVLHSRPWGAPEPPAGGQRTFPLPQAQTVWQSQAGKRTFPVPGEQVL
jgi:hypothetical protein